MTPQLEIKYPKNSIIKRTVLPAIKSLFDQGEHDKVPVAPESKELYQYTLIHSKNSTTHWSF